MASPSAPSDCVCDQCLSPTAAGRLPALMAISQCDGWRDGGRSGGAEKRQKRKKKRGKGGRKKRRGGAWREAMDGRLGPERGEEGAPWRLRCETGGGPGPE